MKHCFIPMMLMAIVALASCEKQLEPKQPEAVKGTYTYTVKAVAPEMESDVKTDYDAAGVFSWSAGDAISLLFHNGETNKFFTLTTADSGSSATFRGEIEEGYEPGASDGTDADKLIWALFPASESHTYTAGAENPVSFYVQPEVDFTASHFSANIPMYDLVASEGGALAFKNLASTYKFIIKDLDSSVKKVQFHISNQTTYALSGSWPIHSDKYINYNWAEPGSAPSCLTYTANVTDNKAVFYVSCRFWGTFQPIVTIYDAETGTKLKEVTAAAAKTPNYLNKVWPVTISAPGAAFVPTIKIDGSFDDWSAITALSGNRPDGSANSRISEWKVASDEQFIYLYAKLNKEKITHSRYFYVGFDFDKNEATGSSHDNIPGLEAYAVVFPSVANSDPAVFVNGLDPQSKVYPNTGSSSTGVVRVFGAYEENTTNAYVEMSIPREAVGIEPGAEMTMAISYNNYTTGKREVAL